MATHYRRGVDFELRMIDKFNRAGYWTIKASRSGGVADFVAFDTMYASSRPLMVQCKRTTRAVPPAEWNHLFAVAARTGCVPLIASAVFDKSGKRVVSYSVHRIRGLKDGEGGPQPWEPWTLRPPVPASVSGLTDTPGTALDAGLTASELASIDQGTHWCECGHGDAVHGPFCFVQACGCGDFLRRIDSPPRAVRAGFGDGSVVASGTRSIAASSIGIAFTGDAPCAHNGCGRTPAEHHGGPHDYLAPIPVQPDPACGGCLHEQHEGPCRFMAGTVGECPCGGQRWPRHVSPDGFGRPV